MSLFVLPPTIADTRFDLSIHRICGPSHPEKASSVSTGPTFLDPSWRRVEYLFPSLVSSTVSALLSTSGALVQVRGPLYKPSDVALQGHASYQSISSLLPQSGVGFFFLAIEADMNFVFWCMFITPVILLRRINMSMQMTYRIGHFHPSGNGS